MYGNTQIHSCLLLDYCRNNLLFLMFSLSHPDSFLLPLPPLLFVYSQVVSSYPKHMLILTNCWQNKTDGVREYGKERSPRRTLIKRKGPLAICDQSPAILQLRWSQRMVLSSDRKKSFFSPTLPRGWAQARAMLKPRWPWIKPLGLFCVGMGDTPAGSSAVTILHSYH